MYDVLSYMCRPSQTLLTIASPTWASVRCRPAPLLGAGVQGKASRVGTVWTIEGRSARPCGTGGAFRRCAGPGCRPGIERGPAGARCRPEPTSWKVGRRDPADGRGGPLPGTAPPRGPARLGSPTQPELGRFPPASRPARPRRPRGFPPGPPRPGALSPFWSGRWEKQWAGLGAPGRVSPERPSSRCRRLFVIRHLNNPGSPCGPRTPGRCVLPPARYRGRAEGAHLPKQLVKPASNT